MVTRQNINTTINAIYIIKSRQMNLNTVNHVVGIDMYYGKGILQHWCIRFLVLTTMSGFNYFLDYIIKTIFIVDFLKSVHEDGNIRSEISFILKPNQAFDLLRENKFAKGITVLEHDDLFLAPPPTTNLTFTIFGLNKMKRVCEC